MGSISDQEPAVEDEEEFVGVVVLVPMQVALDHSAAHDRVDDRGQRLAEPRLVGGGLGVDGSFDCAADHAARATSCGGSVRTGSAERMLETWVLSHRDGTRRIADFPNGRENAR